nr:MAG TPA: hypothetical protein [Caudoviricetes sp.]DAN16027.1 MAG TPA: hypothetical protein [Bacteriophage sp.]
MPNAVCGLEARQEIGGLFLLGNKKWQGLNTV